MKLKIDKKTGKKYRQVGFKLVSASPAKAKNIPKKMSMMERNEIFVKENFKNSFVRTLFKKDIERGERVKQIAKALKNG